MEKQSLRSTHLNYPFVFCMKMLATKMNNNSDATSEYGPSNNHCCKSIEIRQGQPPHLLFFYVNEGVHR